MRLMFTGNQEVKMRKMLTSRNLVMKLKTGSLKSLRLSDVILPEAF